MGMDPTHLSSGILEIKPLFIFTSACAIVPCSTVVCHDWKKALLALRADNTELHAGWFKPTKLHCLSSLAQRPEV